MNAAAAGWTKQTMRAGALTSGAQSRTSGAGLMEF